MDVVRMREGFAFLWLFFYDVIAWTMSQNSSNFGSPLFVF